MMREDVGLDYRDKIIKIDAPPIDGKTGARMIHHTTEVKFSILLITVNNKNFKNFLITVNMADAGTKLN